jgi:UDP:flavonoid glycosyltransferase YjiC (YdhE family)
MARLVITTWGSYGDLFPYIGLGQALAGRGHQVRLVVPAFYTPLVQQAGLEPYAAGPDVDPNDRALIARVMDPVRGPEALVRDWLMPLVEAFYRQLVSATSGADLLVCHPITFAAPVAARVLGVPWVSTVLAPMSFFSVHDPPVIGVAPYLLWLRRFGTAYGRLVRAVADRVTRNWAEPVYRLRRELGIDDRSNPLMDGQFSPTMTLAMFSSVLGAPQQDWPARTRQTGFVFYNGALTMPPELEAFLADGEPPVVFTLGSSAVGAAGRFYVESAAAVERLGVRAVFLTGGFPENEQVARSDRILMVPTAPHQSLFPRAVAVVHHGGVGTTGQGLRAGRPTLVVPHAHDQPDNADRLVRLGVARAVPALAYESARVAQELGRLLREDRFRVRAGEIARRVAGEDGAAAAADAIEGALTEAPTSHA